MILAGDIGGTKTNLALFKTQDEGLQLAYSKQFVSKNYTDFTDILDEFKRELSGYKITSACFGIAGPIIHNKCNTTNLPWSSITINELQKNLNITNVAMLNDLAATAYGMLYLKEDELIQLNPKAHKEVQTCCVIAAGTGLGEGILYFDGNTYHPLATEGGHTDFAPNNTLEDDLLRWLRMRYPDHVSYERVLCGEGISTLYEFLKEYENLPEPQKMQNIQNDIDKSAIISQCAIEENHPLCVKAIELFCKLYGGEAGNLALKSLAIGGVYIGGGIAPKILPILQNGIFMESFVDKGRFKSMLEKMEVKVSLNQETALLGAAHYAKDIFKL